MHTSNGSFQVSAHGGPITKSSAYMEGVVRQTRATFGETLPPDFLSPEEYIIYERLYGPPTQVTRPEDVRLFQGLNKGVVEDLQDEGSPKDALLRENSDGNWEEVEYHIERSQDVQNAEVDQDSVEPSLAEVTEIGRKEALETGEEGPLINDQDDDFKARMTLYRDMVFANQEFQPDEGVTEELEVVEEKEYLNGEQEDLGCEEDIGQEEVNLEGFENDYGDQEDEPTARSHPITTAGKFSTTPRTLLIPKRTVVDPITALLSDASTKKLKEVAYKVFGGPLLPNSTATPSSKKTHLRQMPIALEATQFHMGTMEANAYIAANIPGTYAAVMSTLVEVRKRVGAGWLRGLLSKEGGPRILDVGGGGAGAFAWRELLRAEWEILHPDSGAGDKPVPLGKATIVTGSTTLRHRIRNLFENTTFLPRLPDYNPSLHHPSLEPPNATPRNRYDIIVAPHSLWSLREDYMRKNQVQNLWSLLDPNGGILILIEKGVPRGFELIAGAREVLLKYNIISPGWDAEDITQEPSEGRSNQKEAGMILAPCTNHFKCPLYLIHGKTKGRKDFCHFNQSFNRPPFLQRLHNQSSPNHESLDFSYVAVQRGIDQRQDLGIPQGQAAADAAFAGYETESPYATSSSSEQREEAGQEQEDSSQPSFIHTLSLPRIVLPPLKRDKHVTMDLCTPAGKIERWTIPRSFSKQAYRDARKSRWGDLWALGAKTKVPRNLRPGEKEDKKKERKLRKKNIDRGWQDMQGGSWRRVITEGPRPRKRRAGKSDLDRDDDDDGYDDDDI